MPEVFGIRMDGDRRVLKGLSGGTIGAPRIWHCPASPAGFRRESRDAGDAQSALPRVDEQASSGHVCIDLLFLDHVLLPGQVFCHPGDQNTGVGTVPQPLP